MQKNKVYIVDLIISTKHVHVVVANHVAGIECAKYHELVPGGGTWPMKAVLTTNSWN